VCDHCERTFDETEDTFVSENGSAICAHCEAMWLGGERDRLSGALQAIAAMDPATGYVQQDTARRALEPAFDEDDDPIAAEQDRDNDEWAERVRADEAKRASDEERP
jgi:hypothetical protein